MASPKKPATPADYPILLHLPDLWTHPERVILQAVLDLVESTVYPIKAFILEKTRYGIAYRRAIASSLFELEKIEKYLLHIDDEGVRRNFEHPVNAGVAECRKQLGRQHLEGTTPSSLVFPDGVPRNRK
jgi:hypothetical protein